MYILLATSALHSLGSAHCSGYRTPCNAQFTSLEGQSDAGDRDAKRRDFPVRVHALVAQGASGTNRGIATAK